MGVLYTAVVVAAISGSLFSVQHAHAVVILVDEVSAGADLLGDGHTWTTVNVPAVNGTYRIIGHGRDSIDDGDSFNINLAGGTYSLSVTDNACCTSLDGATTDADTGGGYSAEFKWFSDRADGDGASEHVANSTRFEFTRSPLDAAKTPTVSFAAFFGPVGRAGTYWVDIVVTDADGSGPAVVAAATTDEPTDSEPPAFPVTTDQPATADDDADPAASKVEQGDKGPPSHHPWLSWWLVAAMAALGLLSLGFVAWRRNRKA
jgi:hypothetical protein